MSADQIGPELWRLARDGSADEIRARLDHADLGGEAGGSALRMAVMWSRRDVVELLLEGGVGVDASGRHRETPLHLAVHGAGSASFESARPIIELLLARGADLEHRDELGRTVLMRAAWHANADCVQFLLERGADVSAIDLSKKTALDHAQDMAFVDYCSMFDNTPPSRDAFQDVVRLLSAAAAS